MVQKAVKKAVKKVKKTTVTTTRKPKTNRKRSFGDLFKNLKNVKFEAHVQDGNTLKEFINLIEMASENDFYALLHDKSVKSDRLIVLSKRLMKLKQRYSRELAYLNTIIHLDTYGSPVPEVRSPLEFMNRSGVELHKEVPVQTKDSFAVVTSTLKPEDDVVVTDDTPGTPVDPKYLGGMVAAINAAAERSSTDDWKEVFEAAEKDKDYKVFSHEPVEVTPSESKPEESRSIHDVAKNRKELKFPWLRHMPKSLFQMLEDNLPGDEEIVDESEEPEFMREYRAALALLDRFEERFVETTIKFQVARRTWRQVEKKFQEGGSCDLEAPMRDFLKAERALNIMQKFRETAFREFDASTIDPSELNKLSIQLAQFTAQTDFERLFADTLPAPKERPSFRKYS